MSAMLAVVRHGQSVANKLGLIAGATESHLTPEGVSQAQRLGSRLAETGIVFNAGWSSPLSRANCTLRIIRSRLGQDFIITKDPALIELHSGDAQGKYQGTSVRHTRQGWHWRPEGEGAESYYDATPRVKTFLENNVFPRLFQGQNIVLVTHNGTLKVIQHILEELEPDEAIAAGTSNCGGSIYSFELIGQRLVMISKKIKRL
jgi:broad specificity phosphatase PhoE